MNMSSNIGKKGESIAIEYLENNGYKIINRNYYSRFGEIDIIAKKENYIIFVEVKTRKINTNFNAFEAVDVIKQKKIIKTAMVYLKEKSLNLQPRFDIIAVLFDIDPINVKEINHIKNAFEGVDFFEAF